MPWFADYMHLVFWFFFLTTLIISIWLIQVFFLLARGGESRFPIRETRGFSRAQTGDALTAVIPMCWSITMLMHASTHSSNFDENTDNTSITMSIIAYQWGWNYFFPEDTVLALGCFNDQSVISSDVGLVSINSSPIISELGSLVFGDAWLSNISQRRAVNSLCLPLSNTQVVRAPTSLNKTSNDINYKPSSNGSVSINTDPLHQYEKPLLQSSSNLLLSRVETCFWAPKDVSLAGSSSLYTQLFDTSSFGNSFHFHVANSASRELNIVTFGVTASNAVPPALGFSDTLISLGRNEVHTSRLPKLSSSISPLRSYRLLEDLDFDFLTPNVSISTTRKPISAGYKTSLVGGLVSRLRLTSGVRLPSDTPIHIICGSQDVIHSWAVPGLSIKIDCIPGYNCHRRLLIRWRGLFWGQCMEVCGRYHHWMPLLVNVVHIDIFSMWLKSLSNVVL